MKIKFHDNMNGPQYGADHTLTDNWDCDRNYNDDEYAEVHFRIDCKTYHYQNGFASDDDRNLFYSEGKRILVLFDVPEGTGHKSEHLDGMEHLYLHPQDISGVLRKSKIRDIAYAFDNCNAFSIRWVDIYEDSSALTDEEFVELLKNKRKIEIEDSLIDLFTTKRCNLYREPEQVLGIVSDAHTIRRRSCESGVDYVCRRFVAEILLELVSAGVIVAAETRIGTCYRTEKGKVASYKRERGNAA